MKTFFFAFSAAFLCAFCVLAAPTTFSKVPSAAECVLDESGLYVSLSSEAEKTENSILRWVEVHWWGLTSLDENDFIGIWTHDPMNNSSGIIEYYPVNISDGGATTSLPFDGSEYPDQIDSNTTCLPYWGAYVQNGTLVYVSCLELHPRWMYDMKEALETYGISEILIPGSHDAGAYDENINMIEEVGKWSITQDESFWKQLILGVRYFDMRIAFYNNTQEKYFVNHDEVRFRPLIPYLDDILKFLNQTNEIVIFDIHDFSHGFNDDEIKLNLTILLESYFKDLMIPSSMAPNPLLSDIWNQEKQIIVTYPENETFSELIWGQNVHHLWGDVNTLGELYTYMDTNIPLQSGQGYLWSAMTEFTPNSVDVAMNKWGGLRGAANITNEPVTLWLRREWWTMTNIVAMDFVASSDVVNVVIEGNTKKFECNIRPKRSE